VDADGTERLSLVIFEQGCGTDLILRVALMDLAGKECATWPTAPGALADGVYLLKTTYVDGRVFTKKVAIIQH